MEATRGFRGSQRRVHRRFGCGWLGSLPGIVETPRAGGLREVGRHGRKEDPGEELRVHRSRAGGRPLFWPLLL